jgi:predicted alpha/beta hydrolase
MPRDLKIPATDGFPIAAFAFEPAGTSRGWIVVNAAMGVRQQFYGPFAQYLTELGFSVLTWDYRGIAGSRPAPEGRLRLREWAEKDMEGVLQWALASGAPVAVLGHSLGTQLLGFAPSAARLSAVVGIASQSGEWRNWPFPYNAGMLVLASVLLPGVSGLFGRVPKGLMGEEIPGGPIADWARWIRSRGYLLSEGGDVSEQYGRVTCPMTGFSLADDRYAPRHSVDALYAFYRNARVERIHVVPADIGVSRIGHFGAFRPELKASLWPKLARPFLPA